MSFAVGITSEEEFALKGGDAEVDPSRSFYAVTPCAPKMGGLLLALYRNDNAAGDRFIDVIIADG